MRRCNAEAGATPASVDRLSVLVVNDDADILDELGALLRRRDLDVQLCGSALEARAALARLPVIGAMVADVAMLEGAGLALAAEILLGRLPLLPVELVLLTGYAELRTSASEGATDLLMRQVGLLPEPLRARDVVAAVEAALSRAAARRALAPGLHRAGHA